MDPAYLTDQHDRDTLRRGPAWVRGEWAQCLALLVAGSPSKRGCFLVADDFDVDWFVRMNNTGGPVDVWEVTGVQPAALVQSPEGYFYLPEVMPLDRVRLVQRDLPPISRW